ncbi:MAG: alpha/beta hydrolase-fold protein [Fimbriiglobus sp.]|jgi:predicted peptidase|nr:alpha/beta hydrolase-fold protein [Fimbriiglobus sp.]
MLRRLLPLILFPALAVAADTKTGFVTKSHKNADGSTSEYVVFVPHSYDGTKEFPVILFLHGSGETKGGQKMPVEQGIGPHIQRNEKAFPAFVVIPQSEKRTWQAESDDGKRAMAILDATLKEYKIDPARQYLTGLSMGGYGTWSHAAAYADRWACFAPICGGVRNADDVKATAEKVKNLPCWCWHGDKDTAVKVEKSRELIEAMKKLGAEPRYTELEYVGHNSWDAAYATPELIEWMMKQKKK